jgi:TonB family protein
VDRKPSLRNPGAITMMLHRAYPAHLHDTGVGGTVLVELVVQPNGSVHQARVVNATRPEFQEPARSVAQGMRFVPAEKNGSPVGVRLQIPISFQPQNEAVTLVAPGAPMEASRSAGAVRTVTVDTVIVPMGAGGGSVPSRRTTTRVDTVLLPSTTTGEVPPASAGISTRGMRPSRTATPAMAPARAVPAETTTLVTTARTTRAVPSRAVTTARTTAVAPSRAVTTAPTTALAPSRAVTAAPTTTARTTKVAPARIAPVRAGGQRPARAPKADPTPELLGRAIDPNTPPKPPAPAQP